MCLNDFYYKKWMSSQVVAYLLLLFLETKDAEENRWLVGCPFTFLLEDYFMGGIKFACCISRCSLLSSFIRDDNLFVLFVPSPVDPLFFFLDPSFPAVVVWLAFPFLISSSSIICNFLSSASRSKSLSWSASKLSSSSMILPLIVVFV